MKCYISSDYGNRNGEIVLNNIKITCNDKSEFYAEDYLSGGPLREKANAIARRESPYVRITEYTSSGYKRGGSGYERRVVGDLSFIKDQFKMFLDKCEPITEIIAAAQEDFDCLSLIIDDSTLNGVIKTIGEVNIEK